jgi:RNA polymerase sigma-70 factor (ECF subfamily)
MADSTDQDLIERIQRGERPAFNEFMVRYQDKVYWVARRLLGDHDEALDVTQDVFVKAWNSIATFRGDAQPYTWLYRIATNLSLNRMRRSKLLSAFHFDGDEDDTFVADDTPHDVLERDEVTRLIENAIEKLPEKQRAVFVLRYYQELPYEEISKAMNRSVGALKANYFHAVRKIEDYIRNAMRTV